MKLPFAPLGAVLLIASFHNAIAAPIVAEFKGGESYKVTDAYMGQAGNGWKGPWNYKGYGTNVYAETQPNPTGKGNSLHVTMTSTSDSVEGNKQGALWREFDATEVDVAEPLQFTFTFRPASELKSGQRYVIFNRYKGPHSGTDATCTWIISGTPTGWQFGPEDTGIPVEPGKDYTFVVKVNPAAKTWIGVISDGSSTYTSGELPFRFDANSDGTFLHFSAVVNGVNQKLEFGISSIKISAVK